VNGSHYGDTIKGLCDGVKMLVYATLILGALTLGAALYWACRSGYEPQILAGVAVGAVLLMALWGSRLREPELPYPTGPHPPPSKPKPTKRPTLTGPSEDSPADPYAGWSDTPPENLSETLREWASEASKSGYEVRYSNGSVLLSGPVKREKRCPHCAEVLP
jgi:hypothetical protein